MHNAAWRIEAHIWFGNLDEYAAKEKELLELLEKIQGNGSVTVFFRTTEEYLEIPGLPMTTKTKRRLMN